jgi:hypothetical protein
MKQNGVYKELYDKQLQTEEVWERCYGTKWKYTQDDGTYR